MLVQLFPVDRYLPSLPLLAAGPPPELEARLLESFGPGHWKAQRCDVEPMRYRAAFGATLRYALAAVDTDSGKLATRHFYAKVYRDSGESTFKHLKTLYQQCEGGVFETVRPLTYLHGLNTLVLDAAPGKALDRALLDGDPVEATSRGAARALAALHQCDLGLSNHRSKSDVLARVDRATTLIGWACPDLRSSVNEIAAALECRLGEQHRRPTHLDMKPDHIILDGDRVTLIDLDSAALGEPMLDPASLVARLEALPHVSALSEETARAAASGFLEHYFARVPESWHATFGLSYACAALKVALFFVQHQAPGWQQRVATFVGKAGQGACGRM